MDGLVAAAGVATTLVGAVMAAQLVGRVAVVVMALPSMVVMVAVAVRLEAVGVYVIEFPVVPLVIVPPVNCHEYVQFEQDATEAVCPALQGTGAEPMVMVPLGVAASRLALTIPSILKLGSPV